MDMNYYDKKYANLLVNHCLANTGIKPLLIIYYDRDLEPFVKVVEDVAKKSGYPEVASFYFPNKEIYSYLRKTTIESADISKVSNFEILAKMAEKNTNVLYLEGYSYDYSYGVSPAKEYLFGDYYYAQAGEFEKKIVSEECPHCIAKYPTMKWAKKVYPDRTPKQAYLLLYYTIMEFCKINKPNPKSEWNKYLEKQRELEEKINELRIKRLKYTSSNGTDLKIELPDKHIWLSAGTEVDAEGNKVQYNMPSFEIFTTPLALETEGHVQITMPLHYGKQLINPFSLDFEKGEVVRYSTEYKNDLKALKKLIGESRYGRRLGEVALVENTSPIYQSNTIFYETLFDENATCHIALGDCIRDCYESGKEMSNLELMAEGINTNGVHTDVMIGSDDLEITADTKEGKKLIYSKGRIIL